MRSFCINSGNYIFLCSSELEGRSPSCRLSDRVCFLSSNKFIYCKFRKKCSSFHFVIMDSIMIWMLICCQSFVKASDQLRQWFEDDDALERTINGEYVHKIIFMNVIPWHIFLLIHTCCDNWCSYLTCLFVGGFGYHVEMKLVLCNLFV
jgi:hypothetical protein